MPSENSFTTVASNISNENNLALQLHFKYFNKYAAYLLEHKLNEFATAQLQFSRDIQLPVLNLFKNFTDEQLIEISAADNKELLGCCAENKAGNYINSSVEKWLNNQSPVITKSEVIAEDIILVSSIRRSLFRHFITCYTTDIEAALKILNEAELFIVHAETAGINAFFQMHHQLFQQAQALSHIGNWQLDLKTKKIIWSDEMYRIYELELQSPLASEKISVYNHPADEDAIDAHMQWSLQTLKPHDFYYRIILKDGKQKILHARGEVKLDKEGIPIELFGTLQDVTEQKQKENELEKSKKFAEKITDVSPCMITAYNIKSGKYIFLNKGLQTLLGYDSEEFYEKGRKFYYELVHADELELVKEKTQALITEANDQNRKETEQAAELKFRVKHKNGLYRWMQTFTTVFNRDIHNNVQDMLNVSIDVTESHQLTLQLALMNEEIKFKELQHQRMINEVEDYAIILMDKDGFIQNWNKGAEKIKGYSASEIVGKNFRIFYRQEDLDKQLPDFLIKEALEKGKTRHEGWRLRKDGTSFWGNVVITALHDESNNLIGFSKVTRNLTERKLAEDKLREYARQIEQRNEELQRINKDLDSFTYMASHDLQEPLRKIKTFCNIILSKSEENLPTEISGYFERIISSVTRMQTLIDSLLSYSRATGGEIILLPTSLNTIIDDVKKDLGEMLEEKQVTIIAGKLPVIKMEPMQFHQLFFNLIENAIKYRREDIPPEIKIAAGTFWKPAGNGEEALFYRISLSDNGIGFEQQYADNIFKLFQRLHGRSEYTGTGIGLAICKKIVENHHGTITAIGEPGKGSTFIIEFPADDNKK